VLFDGGCITAIERGPAAGADAPIVAPGLIDLHVHGFAGCDPLEDLGGLAHALAAAGTTAFLPTLFPDDPAHLGVQSESIWKRQQDLDPAAGARVLGTHLEGPFLNPGKAGGLPADRLLSPAPGALRALLGAEGFAPGERRGIRQMTVAPELPGGIELVRELVFSGIRVSLGHSKASSDEARTAAELGASGATHLFNAMEGIHHRRATLASFALSADELVAEVICDLVHVGPEALRLALRARGVRGLALVSDALRAGGTAERRFESHGRRCIVRDGAIWLEAQDASGEPRLTGAEACQLEAVRRLVRAGVTGPAEALIMASETPARALGLERELGCLVSGARADLIVLDARTLALREVLLAGEPLRRPAVSGPGRGRR
jgi:N-acetylglucosamine-6-phosphate deacetylase